MSALLKTFDLTKRFQGVHANNKVNLTIEKGSITALIGPNGSGKTTFINQVSGAMPASSGQIVFEGQDITDFEGFRYAEMGIARTFQRINLFNSMSVVENVLVARKKFFKSWLFDIVFSTPRLKREEVEQFEKSMEILRLLGIADLAFESPLTLPYGKRRILEIARAFALEPRLILLDEPAAGMTKDEFKGIMQIMHILKDKGITMLLVEHTMEFIREVSDYVYVLNFGEIIAEGKFEHVTRQECVVNAYLGGDE